MSLKIPELQVMLPRASEISRTQQVQMQENVQRQQDLHLKWRVKRSRPKAR